MLTLHLIGFRRGGETWHITGQLRQSPDPSNSFQSYSASNPTRTRIIISFKVQWRLLDLDNETYIDSDKHDLDNGKESRILIADGNEYHNEKDHQGANIKTETPNVLLADSPIYCAAADTRGDLQPSGVDALEEGIDNG